jgi:hypothetical protein
MNRRPIPYLAARKLEAVIEVRRNKEREGEFWPRGV